VALRGLRGGTRREKIEDVLDYIQDVPFFEEFAREQIREILSASNLLKVPKGKIILTEGEIDDSFFIILSGRVAVQKNKKNISIFTRGQCFGEMAYLSGRSRAATVMADTDCILMKISGTLLDKSTESIQLVFLRNFARTLVKRLSKTAQLKPGDQP
jgi:serine/threonine-protein kinase